MEHFYSILEERIKQLHPDISFDRIKDRLENNKEKRMALHKMEETGGEPNLFYYDSVRDKYVFVDMSKESPNRRSLCYDEEARQQRKSNKPASSVSKVCEEMGIELINEEEYRKLQSISSFDLKTSSWLKTPVEIRALKGAIFGDRRYNTVFIYHNGADSYYAARGFRGKIEI